MAVELATGYVSIVPSARNFGRNLGRDIAGPLNTAGRTAGDSASSAFGTRFTAGLAAVGKRAGLALGIGITAAAGFGVKLAADFQQTTIAFEGILGSAEAAEKTLGELREFAAKTPFEFPGLADAAKNLLAVGFGAEDVIPIMGTLGDVAATLGVGEAEISGVVRALGQMRGKGKASAEELQQISEQIPGFSAIKAIADDMGISVADAFEEVSKGAVPADDAIEAILNGMESFPGAAGAMERQSKTLNGVLSTFKDTVGNIAIDFITPYLPAISRAIEVFADKVGEFFYTLKTGFTEDEGTRIEGFALGIRDAFGFFQEVLGVVVNYIQDHVIPTLSGLVRDGLENLSTWWKNNGDNVGNFFEDLGDVFNNILAPAMGAVGRALKDTIVPKFIEFGQFLIQNDSALIGVLTALAAAMGLYAFNAIAAATASIVAFAILAGVLIVIAAIAAALYYAYTNWTWFRTGVDNVVEGLRIVIKVFQEIITWIQRAIDKVEEFLAIVPGLEGFGAGVTGDGTAGAITDFLGNNENQATKEAAKAAPIGALGAASTSGDISLTVIERPGENSAETAMRELRWQRQIQSVVASR